MSWEGKSEESAGEEDTWALLVSAAEEDDDSVSDDSFTDLPSWVPANLGPAFPHSAMTHGHHSPLCHRAIEHLSAMAYLKSQPSDSETNTILQSNYPSLKNK